MFTTQLLLCFDACQRHMTFIRLRMLRFCLLYNFTCCRYWALSSHRPASNTRSCENGLQLWRRSLWLQFVSCGEREIVIIKIHGWESAIIVNLSDFCWDSVMTEKESGFYMNSAWFWLYFTKHISDYDKTGFWGPAQLNPACVSRNRVLKGSTELSSSSSSILTVFAHLSSDRHPK